MVQGSPRTQSQTQSQNYGWDPAVLRVELEELRRERAEQLEMLSQTPVGEDDLTAPRLAAIRGMVADIDAALERLDNGRYGLCERCEAAIPAERLELKPHARHCVECQQAGERG